MNSLSWLLYFASVCGGLQGVAVMFAVVSATVTGVSAICFACTMDDYSKNEHALVTKIIRWTAPLFLFFSIAAALIPSERTIYLIAASEMGQKVYNTETGQKAVAAVNRYLDQVGKNDK